MREIKFRAWDKQVNKLVKVTRIDWETKTVDWFYDNKSDWEVTRETRSLRQGLSRVILMQFAGLHDKKGKEVYEGDIVKDKENCNFSIVWDYHNCGFYLQSTEDDEYNMEMVYILNNKIEIIGNIYENPELLKNGI